MMCTCDGVTPPPQPDVLPGDCWCFEGSSGYATITVSGAAASSCILATCMFILQLQLANVVMVTSVTVEHIPVSLSPVGETRSAPKDFTVLVGSSH